MKKILPISLFIGLISYLPPSLAKEADSIAKTLTTRGKVTATLEDKLRDLKRGSELFRLDVVQTNEKASVKMRFIDGTLLSMIPESNMALNTYKFYKQEPKRNRMNLGLKRGGFKSISGLISKKNPNAVTVDCGVAVIGIRGTVYEVYTRKILKEGSSVACKKNPVKLSALSHNGKPLQLAAAIVSGKMCAMLLTTGAANVTSQDGRRQPVSAGENKPGVKISQTADGIKMTTITAAEFKALKEDPCSS